MFVRLWVLPNAEGLRVVDRFRKGKLSAIQGPRNFKTNRRNACFEATIALPLLRARSCASGIFVVISRAVECFKNRRVWSSFRRDAGAWVCGVT